jgi:hypothetical protein
VLAAWTAAAALSLGEGTGTLDAPQRGQSKPTKENRMSNHPSEHSARELAGSLADTLDHAATWLTGGRHGRTGVNEILSWVTGRSHETNAVETVGSWIFANKRQ